MSRSLRRSIAYVIGRFILARRHLVARADAADLRVRFRTEDAMGRHLYKYGVFEPELTNLLLRHLRLEAGDVFVDIGANLGWYSLLVSRCQPTGVRVICFEPDPETFALLQDNIELNGQSRIEAHEAAVSDVNSRRTLYRYSSSNTGRHSLLPINTAGEVEVRTTTLTGFCTRAGVDPARIRFLKMDVEGYEPLVLRGMQDLLPGIPSIMAEYSPRYMRRGGLDPSSDYLDPLFDAGFVPCRAADGHLERVERDLLESVDGNRNLVWLNTQLRERWPFASAVGPDL